MTIKMRMVLSAWTRSGCGYWVQPAASWRRHKLLGPIGHSTSYSLQTSPASFSLSGFCLNKTNFAGASAYPVFRRPVSQGLTKEIEYASLPLECFLNSWYSGDEILKTKATVKTTIGIMKFPFWILFTKQQKIHCLNLSIFAINTFVCRQKDGRKKALP